MAAIIGLFIMFFVMPFGDAIAFPANSKMYGNRIAAVILLLTYLVHRFSAPPSHERTKHGVMASLVLLILWATYSLLWCPAPERTLAILSIFALIQIAIQVYIVYVYLTSRRRLLLLMTAYVSGLCFVGGCLLLGIGNWAVDPSDSNNLPVALHTQNV